MKTVLAIALCTVCALSLIRAGTELRRSDVEWHIPARAQLAHDLLRTERALQRIGEGME